MNFVDATHGYEGWLGQQLPLISNDLAAKHKVMNEAVFPFLRATYYRWVQVWHEHAGALAESPRVLAVGDLHIENYGTWRDAEGRLVWGLNDFDEAAKLPYSFDLTRLAVSASLAVAHHGLKLTRARIAARILEGYSDALDCGGRPFVLEERHEHLRAAVLRQGKEPSAFWKKLTSAEPTPMRPNKSAARLLASLVPHGVQDLRIVHRIAGLGSLGRERFTAVGQLEGGFIAREVKPLSPPASAWALRGASRKINYSRIVKRAVRCGDPFLRERDTWIGRRLSPSNGRVELDGLRHVSDAELLLHSMGFEVANVHLGSLPAKKLQAAHRHITATEFASVARTLERVVQRDWKDWRER